RADADLERVVRRREHRGDAGYGGQQQDDAPRASEFARFVKRVEQKEEEQRKHGRRSDGRERLQALQGLAAFNGYPAEEHERVSRREDNGQRARERDAPRRTAEGEQGADERQRGRTEECAPETGGDQVHRAAVCLLPTAITAVR